MILKLKKMDIKNGFTFWVLQIYMVLKLIEWD